MQSFRGRMAAAVLGVLALAGSAGMAAALDRFVAANGSDTGNDCLTSAAPCRGIANAVAQALSGDTIKIGRGFFPAGISLAASTVLTIEGGYADDFASRDIEDHRTSLEGGSTQVLALAAGTGAAIAVSVDGVTMRRAKIPGGNGGAVNAVQSGSGTLSLTLSRTVLTRHRTGSGGGVYIESGGTGSAALTMSDSSVFANKVDVGGGLYALAHDQSALTVTVENSFITKNKVTGATALYVQATDDATVTAALTNVTINRNKHPSTLVLGDVFLQTLANGSIAATLRNSILWDRKLGAHIACEGDVTLTLDHNNYGTLSNQDGTTNDLGGNVQQDPRLKGPAATPHLKPTSLMINAGICAGAPPQDFEGDPRPSGASCDIGADEYAP